MAFQNEQKLVLTLVLAFSMFASLATCRRTAVTDTETTMSMRHEQWMNQYGRVYKDEAEKEARFEVFKKNVEFIESFNNGGIKTYTLGINKFADLTNEEFKHFHNGFKIPNHGQKPTTGFRYANVADVPQSMDWNANGAVTPVKNQEQCRSCWAFSAVAAVEGINQITTGNLISLSEQELVDCNTSGEGCNGGLMDNAFIFIVQNKGLAAESDYPYDGTAGTCDTEKQTLIAASITGYEEVPANDESSLLKAVANQPVSVAIDASRSDLQFYKSGVFTGECGTDLDHGVTVVGYGSSEDGTKFWLMKNSWGSDWGEEGYIRMQRDVSALEGLCGIAMQASYPTA